MYNRKHVTRFEHVDNEQERNTVAIILFVQTMSIDEHVAYIEKLPINVCKNSQEYQKGPCNIAEVLQHAAF